MSNSLRLYRIISGEIDQVLDHLRATQQRNLSWMMTGLYLGKHVHLAKMAEYRPGRAKLESKERQFRRFVANEAVGVRDCYAPFARTILHAAASGGRVRLLIDTLALSGRRQILLVALAYRRRALPLIWQVRRATGVTDSQTQIQLLQALQPWLPEQTEVVVMGDGEFHSVDLMAWLSQQGWHYRLRLHADTYIQQADGTWVQLQDLDLAPGQRRYLHNVHITQDKAYGPVHLAGVWADDQDQPWYLATDQPATYGTVQDYTRRMWIEELLGDWQGSGFQLHQSRLYPPARLSRLLLVLSLVYTWLMHVGAWLIKRGFRPVIDRTDRRDRSLFQLGRHWVQRCLTNDDSLHIGFKPYS